MDELKDFYDEVARVAYELYEQRDRIHGHDVEDWLQAETIVKNRRSQKAAQRRSAGNPGIKQSRRKNTL